MTMDTESREMAELSVKLPHLPSQDETVEKSVLVKKKKYSCCSSLKVFLVGLAFAFFSKALSGSYTKSMITQIERRFAISTSAIGFIDGSFEMGNLLVIVFVSYFGAKLHRPKIIGAGCLLMAIGTFIIAMPHFFMGRYKYETIVTFNSTSASISPCLPFENNKMEPDAIDKLSVLQAAECRKASGSLMWVSVFVGNLLRGVGEAPIMPLGISYIDDFAKPENSGFYLACVQTVGIIGPVFGFLLGSLCAKLYVDIGMVNLDTVTINPRDSRWVGAWWLGFLIAGIVSLVTAFPFWFMPKSLPKEGEQKDSGSSPETQTLAKESHSNEKTVPREQKAKLSEIAKDFIPSLKILLRNPIFMLFLIMSVLSFNSFIGMITFKPKYIEQQFGQSASRTNLIIGTTNIPALAVGILLSGIIMKKSKMSVLGIIKLAIGTGVAAFLLNLLFFAFTCENSQVAGLTVTYDGNPQISYQENTLHHLCNSNCTCSTKQWDPVCGDNGITYVSACLAGCKSSTGTGKNTVFHNCSCALATNAVLPHTTNSSTVLGQCPKQEDCSKMFLYYLAVGIAGAFVAAFSITPMSIILLRTVNPEFKSFAIGLHTLCTRTLAGIPAPIYFGALIDTTCLKWETRPCGGQGACRIYNTDSFRMIFLGLISALRGVAYFLFIPIYFLAKKKFGESVANGGKDESSGMTKEANSNMHLNEIKASKEEKETPI